jgi:hypothetical protein
MTNAAMESHFGERVVMEKPREPNPWPGQTFSPSVLLARAKVTAPNRAVCLGMGAEQQQLIRGKT